ncbi:MAG: putative hydrolase [Chloroflexota bacterium]|nr:putative hydrolase [Chloroflexota bacterium]
MVAEGRHLSQELAGVGPTIGRILHEWVDEPPPTPVPPPLRHDFITMAEAHQELAAAPQYEGVRGDLQMHSLWSDGGVSILEMAEAAAEMGHEYIAITDHSKGLKIAGGIDEEALLRQEDEIVAVNERLAKQGTGLRVLRSMEMNISPDGSGDMEPEALARLDLVLGSFHSQLRRKEDQTDRYLAALGNPQVDVLGHPRGRIYNFRMGLWADWARVFDEAARLGKAVEIDCYPDRQDLNVELLHPAAASGVTISIGTDSHSPWELACLPLGLAAAARAGIPPERILNFKPMDELLAWVRDRRAMTS